MHQIVSILFSAFINFFPKQRLDIGCQNLGILPQLSSAKRIASHCNIILKEGVSSVFRKINYHNCTHSCDWLDTTIIIIISRKMESSDASPVECWPFVEHAFREAAKINPVGCCSAILLDASSGQLLSGQATVSRSFLTYTHYYYWQASCCRVLRRSHNKQSSSNKDKGVLHEAPEELFNAIVEKWKLRAYITVIGLEYGNYGTYLMG